MKHLEDLWKPKALPVVLLDTRVYLHKLIKRWPDDCDREHAFKHFYARWVQIANQPFYWLGNQPLQVAFIDDYKDARGKYWRYDWYEPYKGNRPSDQPMKYNICFDALMHYLKQDDVLVPIFRQEGFEADDFAGLFARLKREGYAKGRPLVISTVDYDHQQLISDEHEILWANVLKYRPLLRDEYGMLSVHTKRGIIFAEPADIIAHKVKYGDAGDNISPGAPREIIDLIDPPVKPDSAEAKAWLSKEVNTCNADHLREASQWLIRQDFKAVAD